MGRIPIVLIASIIVASSLVPMGLYASETNYEDLARELELLREEVRYRYDVAIDRISTAVNILVGAFTGIGLLLVAIQIMQSRSFGLKINEANELIKEAGNTRDALMKDEQQIAEQQERISQLSSRADDILEAVSEVLKGEIRGTDLTKLTLRMTAEGAQKVVKYGRFLKMLNIEMNTEELFRFAVARFNDGDEAGALSILEDIIDRGRADEQVFFATGYIYQQKDEPERANELYDAALRHSPGYVPALLNKAALLSSSGEYPSAIRLLLKAHASDPGDPRCLINLSDVLIKSGDRDRAREVIQLIHGQQYDLEPVEEFQLAINEATIDAANGNTQQAAERIARLPVRQTWLKQIENDPDLASVLKEPNYISWRAKVEDSRLHIT